MFAARLLNLTRWPAILVFALAGLMAVVLAFVTLNLFAQAMANLDFISRHGWLAVMEGALWQLLGLTFWGSLALMSYLIFKACEVELTFRYRRWAEAESGAGPGRRRLRFRRRTRGNQP